MKKSPLLLVLPGLLGLGAGFLLSRGMAPEQTENASEERSESVRSSVVRSGQPDGVIPGGKRLDRLLALQRAGTTEENALRREIERMSSGELQERMLDLAQILEKEPNSPKSPGFRLALGWLGEELFRRKGEAALEWAADLEGECRKLALQGILGFAAGESPVMAKKWIDGLAKSYGRDWGEQFIWRAIHAAAQRGEDAWLEAAGLYRDSIVYGPYSAPVYAENFDFAKMLEHFPQGHGVAEALGYWAAKDKEAAWAAVKALFEQGKGEVALNMGAMWGGVAAAEGNETATAWLIGRLDEIPENLRAEAVKNLFRQNTMLPDDYRNLMQAFSRPEDRHLFATSTFAVWGDVKEVHAVMSVLPHQDRVEVILQAADSYRKFYETTDADRAEQVAKYFDERITDYSLTEGEAAKVREALGR